MLLSSSEKTTLAEIAHRLGRKALADVAATAKPDSLLRWYRELIAKKFDGSKFRRALGRPPVTEEIERLVVRIARENPSWGYDRIKGAMINLGYGLSDQTVGNILRHHDIPPAPKRKQTTSWKDFIRAHMAVIVGTDFFTVEVLTLKGLKTYYVLFFLHLESRRIPYGQKIKSAFIEAFLTDSELSSSTNVTLWLSLKLYIFNSMTRYSSSFGQLAVKGGQRMGINLRTRPFVRVLQIMGGIIAGGFVLTLLVNSPSSRPTPSLQDQEWNSIKSNASATGRPAQILRR